MFDFSSVGAIAKYEQRILLRSWFFRIFAILSLLIIGVYSGTVLFDRGPFTWSYRSLPTALVYSNMFLLNIFQSIIAIFLATDFLKRDKKLDTSEVLFIRPMSNFEYLIGKTLGLLSVFVLLNVLVVILTSVFVISSDQVPFRLLPIIWYFLLMSVPTLVFVIGISFALMSIIRNQSITFILLLGYVALVLFYLADKGGFVFDYMAYKYPMAFSEIVGFSDLKHIIIQRGSYFITGLGLMFFTVIMLRRKPNKSISNLALGILTGTALLIAVVGFVYQASQMSGIEKKRKLYVQQSSSNYQRNIPLMRRATINVEHGSILKISSKMSLRNRTASAIDTLIFSLNPGFKVEKVATGNGDLSFSQTGMLVSVFPKMPMQIGEDLDIEMSYSGLPDYDVAYLDVDQDDVYGVETVQTLKVARKYGFYDSNYVLLTKEILWYPVLGIAYDPVRPAVFRQQFTRFELNVQTQKGFVPVSQGERKTKDSISFQFSESDPLPQLSLAIAKFKEKKIDINGIHVSMNYIDGHSSFMKYFNELGDTAKSLITEFLNDYERPLSLYYPYKQFSLVEAPVHFASQPHSWTSTLAHSQPQIVFYPEGGFNMRQADFRSTSRNVKRNSERTKEGLSEKEIQARVFTSFLRGMFAESGGQVTFGRAGINSSSANPYSIFPNYYYYVNFISSDDCPVLNYAFESYLSSGSSSATQMFRGMGGGGGIGDDERANLLLKNKSLKQIIAEEKDKQEVSRVLKLKGSYLLTWMEKQSGADFNKFLLEYLYDNSFKEIKYTDLAENLSSRLNVNMGTFINEWYNANQLPSFVLGEMKLYETTDNSQVVSVIRTKVSNFGNADGMIKFTIQAGDFGGGGGGFGGGGGRGGFAQSTPETRIFLIEANKTKEIQIVLSGAPRMITLNTLVSENIPTSNMVFGLVSEKDDRITPVEYEKIVDKAVEWGVPGELITDNTDPLFSIIDPAQDNPIRKFFADKRKTQNSRFVGQMFGPPPTTWSLTAGSDYYGITEKSAYIIRSGNGQKTAVWKKPLPSAGYYGVYVWLNAQRRFNMRGGQAGGGGNRGGGGNAAPAAGGNNRGNSEAEGKFVYTIKHDDGVDKVELAARDVVAGWNLLGSFYISSDTAMVTISDEGGVDRIVADAVKWVLNEKQ